MIYYPSGVVFRGIADHRRGISHALKRIGKGAPLFAAGQYAAQTVYPVWILIDKLSHFYRKLADRDILQPDAQSA